MNELPLTDYELERALAQEAVFDWSRFRAMGLSADDFAHNATRSLVEAAGSAEASGHAVGVESVATALQRAGKLASMGGLDGLKHLLVSNASPDPDRLKELRRLRDLRDGARRAQVAAERGDELAAREALSGAVDQAAHLPSAPVDAVELCTTMLREIVSGRRAKKLVHPGLEMLHQAAGMLMAPSCLVVGAATNTGKSSWALAMLLAAAGRNVTCGYVSAEDAADVPASRMLAAVTGLSSKRIVTGQLDRDDMLEIDARSNDLNLLSQKIWFSFCIGGTEIDACAAMSAQAARGARIIVVDYVQTLTASKQQQNRANDMRWVAQRLKAHAYRLGVVLVLVSQLSRPPKGTKNWEPCKYDLKETGDIENCAEYIVLLWRDEDSDIAPINVKFDKGKIGGIGSKWQMRRNPRSAVLEEIPGSFRSPGK